MRTLKTILVALGMSDTDTKVIQRALLIAKDVHAQIHFIHIVDIPVLDIEITSEFLSQEIDKEDLKKRMIQKVNDAGDTHGLEPHFHIKIGTPSEHVIHTAQKIQADLIVMGAHTRPKIEEYYLGSTAENIAKKSARPILVVKNSVQGVYKNILAPTDFSLSSKKSIKFAQIAFKSSEIKIAHAYMDLDAFDLEHTDIYEYDSKDSITGNYSKIERFKNDIGIKKLDLFESGTSLDQSIADYIIAHQSEIIILGSSGSDVIGYLSSVASGLLRKTPSDVLIYIPLTQEE
ncbi:universal stress protein [bacterium]|nr:universal stress protein [bacterium]MBU1989880.1 universal stress protein [bacterium]